MALPHTDESILAIVTTPPLEGKPMLKIRPATTEDLPACAELIRSLYEELEAE